MVKHTFKNPASFYCKIFKAQLTTFGTPGVTGLNFWETVNTKGNFFLFKSYRNFNCKIKQACLRENLIYVSLSTSKIISQVTTITTVETGLNFPKVTGEDFKRRVFYPGAEFSNDSEHEFV